MQADTIQRQRGPDPPRRSGRAPCSHTCAGVEPGVHVSQAAAGSGGPAGEDPGLGRVWVGRPLSGRAAGRARTPGGRPWEAGPRAGCWAGPDPAEQPSARVECQPGLPFLPLGLENRRPRGHRPGRDCGLRGRTPGSRLPSAMRSQTRSRRAFGPTAGTPIHPARDPALATGGGESHPGAKTSPPLTASLFPSIRCPRWPPTAPFASVQVPPLHAPHCGEVGLTTTPGPPVSRAAGRPPAPSCLVCGL